MRCLRRKVGWALLAALCFGGAVAVPAAAAGHTAPGVVEGRVNAVNTATGALTVGEVALGTGSGTLFTLNGQAASLGDLAVGDTARATYEPASLLAREVQAYRPLAELWGTITGHGPATGTSDATLTFQLRDGSFVTLFINATTVLRLEDGAQLEDLVGRTALARYDRVTLVAKEVIPGAPEPAPPGTALEQREVWGQVTQVDAGTHTLTLVVQRAAKTARRKPKKQRGAWSAVPGGPPAKPGQTLAVICDEQTEVTLNDQPATFADLARGDGARCAFVVDGERNRAVRIQATLPPGRTVGGLVLKVDTTSIPGMVVIGNRGRSVPMIVTGGTLIQLDGQEATLEQLKEQQRATALYVIRNDTPQALAIMAMSPPERKGGAQKKNRARGAGRGRR